MQREGRTALRVAVWAVLAGAAVGVLATIAGVVHACGNASLWAERWMADVPTDQGYSAFCVVEADRSAVSVLVQFSSLAPAGTMSIEAVHEEITRDWEAEKAAWKVDTMIGSPATSVLATEPAGWHRGLSDPRDTESGRWRETIYGWPYRCFLVRGRQVRDGPLTLANIPKTMYGEPGWSIAWGEAIRSVAILGSPAAVLTVAVLLASGAARRRWRKRKGRCPSCGYDLRGVPAGCPECGLPQPEA